MTTQEAIKKSIEGGFEAYAGNVARGELPVLEAVKDIKRRFKIEEVLMRPDFWQCLGKAMGWTDNHISQGFPHYGKQWHFEWHRLINRLAEGKTIEDYFKQLK